METTGHQLEVMMAEPKKHQGGERVGRMIGGVGGALAGQYLGQRAGAWTDRNADAHDAAFQHHGVDPDEFYGQLANAAESGDAEALQRLDVLEHQINQTRDQLRKQAAEEATLDDQARGLWIAPVAGALGRLNAARTNAFLKANGLPADVSVGGHALSNTLGAGGAALASGYGARSDEVSPGWTGAGQGILGGMAGATLGNLAHTRNAGQLLSGAVDAIPISAIHGALHRRGLVAKLKMRERARAQAVPDEVHALAKQAAAAGLTADEFEFLMKQAGLGAMLGGAAKAVGSAGQAVKGLAQRGMQSARQVMQPAAAGQQATRNLLQGTAYNPQAFHGEQALQKMMAPTGYGPGIQPSMTTRGVAVRGTTAPKAPPTMVQQPVAPATIGQPNRANYPASQSVSGIIPPRQPVGQVQPYRMAA